MFRQVVAHRWAEGTDVARRAGYVDAMEALREIPELVGLRYGADAGHFPGNHEFVAVMDFPDFPSARRYVAHELHQHFVNDHARHVVDARTVVQHDWAVGTPAGLHHVTLPVTDVATSRAWYAATFDFRTRRELTDGGRLTGAVLRQLGTDLVLALQEDPERARALAGFNAVCLAAGTPADLDTILARLDSSGVPHTAPAAGHPGLVVDVPDPDGHVISIRTLL